MSNMQEETQESGNGPDALVKTLIAGVASAAAAYGAHKALTRTGAGRSVETDDDNDSADDVDDDEPGDDEPEDDDDEPESSHEEEDDAEREPSRTPAKPSRKKAAVSSALVPVAERAAESAGRYVAQNAPDVVTKTIVPRFIDAFENAN